MTIPRVILHGGTTIQGPHREPDRPAASCIAAAVAILVMAVLGGCSGGDAPAPDPLAAYKAQVLDWQDCDPGILGAESNEVMQQAMGELGQRLKCVTVTVPLDYDAPVKGDLKIAVMRTAAAVPTLRRGAIFLNPGGPGGDGLGLAAQFGRKWNNLNAANPSAAELKRISDQYDLIGFSPRGVGASTQLVCAGNEQLKPTPNDRSSQTIRNQLYNAKLIADACLKNPITPYITTEHTVRDMDLIRHLLKDEKLNYIGISYGTWLGAWYVSRFPERTGRMLLDSNMDFSADFDAAALDNARGRQRVLGELLAPYAAKNGQKFSLGADADFISRALWAGFDANLHGKVYSTVDETLGSSGAKDFALYALRVGQVTDQLLKGNPGATTDQLVSLIGHTGFLNDPQLNDRARERAAELIQGLYQPAGNLQLDNSDSVYVAVTCNDTASVTDEGFWIEQGNRQFENYPVFGGRATQQPCIYWGGPRVDKPPLSNANATVDGLLLLQSRYDTRTPSEGAVKAFSHLSNASMIMVENEYSHGLFPYDDDCVDLAVARYFNEGILPARMTTCEGRDKELVQLTATAAKEAEAARPGMYLDPEKDREITRRIRSMIR